MERVRGVPRRCSTRGFARLAGCLTCFIGMCLEVCLACLGWTAWPAATPAAGATNPGSSEGLVEELSLLAPEPTAEFRVQVYDTEGLPVPGVTVRVHEDARRKLCGDVDCSCPAAPFPRSSTAVSDETGEAIAIFEYPTCQYVSSDPFAYETITHADWLGVEVPPNAASGAPQAWLIAQVDGSAIYVTHESALATRFAPVLHAHAGVTTPMERQAGLADPDEILQAGWGSIELFNILGARVYGPAQQWHGWDDAHGLWDTFGHNASPFWGRLDIDDSRWNASTATRPLFYHVFPHGDGVVIQYWYFFAANDTREMWGQGFHEGDWEHVAIKVRYENGDWAPTDVNFYIHEGGERRDPAECWWSPTALPTYEGLAQGYDPARPHLHVWISANAHSSYNRFAETYTLAVDGPSGCDLEVWDRCDYNLADNPRGAHAFFEYDTLVDMGEVVATEDAHGFEWAVHYDGGLEFNRFVGHFGRGSSASCPSGCPPLICMLMMDLASFFGGGVPAAYGPLAPSRGAAHEWTVFHDDPAEFRWGNEAPGGSGVEVAVGWNDRPPERQYLGAFRMCASGLGDPLAFEIAENGASGVPRFARVTVIDGEVSLLGATETCGLSCAVYPLTPVDGGTTHELRIPALEGEGRVRVDVFPEGEGAYDAWALEADIVECSTSSHDTHSDDWSRTLRIFPVPMTDELQISWRSPVRGDFGEMIEIFDVLGRRVRALPVSAGTDRMDWDGLDDHGTPVSDGVYLVALVRDGRVAASTKAVRFSVR